VSLPANAAVFYNPDSSVTGLSAIRKLWVSPAKRVSRQCIISWRDADFPVLISSMSGLAIYHSSRRS